MRTTFLALFAVGAASLTSAVLGAVVDAAGDSLSPSLRQEGSPYKDGEVCRAYAGEPAVADLGCAAPLSCFGIGEGGFICLYLSRAGGRYYEGDKCLGGPGKLQVLAYKCVEGLECTATKEGEYGFFCAPEGSYVPAVEGRPYGPSETCRAYPGKPAVEDRGCGEAASCSGFGEDGYVCACRMSASNRAGLLARGTWGSPKVAPYLCLYPYLKCEGERDWVHVLEEGLVRRARLTMPRHLFLLALGISIVSLSK